MPEKIYRIAIFLSCYKRPEYTSVCLRSLEKLDTTGLDLAYYLYDDGSNDGTDFMLDRCELSSKRIVRNNEPKGLRANQIDFFQTINNRGYDFIAKMDNDCCVPYNWLTELTNVMLIVTLRY